MKKRTLIIILIIILAFLILSYFFYPLCKFHRIGAFVEDIADSHFQCKCTLTGYNKCKAPVIVDLPLSIILKSPLSPQKPIF